MNRKELISEINKKKSFLCVGLDTDISKIPTHLLDADDPVYEFNKLIIDATKEYCVAYKPNIAFYESNGIKGWESLRKTLEYIPDNIFTIADAKRGDIGNTSKMYARTFFEQYKFHSVTVAPYMGEDSVTPFLEFKNKWAIILALTSNKGAIDFQLGDESEQLYQKVLRISQKWGDKNNIMYVVGATRGELFKEIRKIVPEHFLLVPGIGAQGGSLEDVCNFGLNKDYGLLINASRSIIYASSDNNFASRANEEAKHLQVRMSNYI